jgi:uncharacterized protein
MAAPSVVVMADAPRPGRCIARLEPRLGPNGCALLQAELIRVAVAWGRMLGPAFVAVRPPDAVGEVAAPGASVFAQKGPDLGARLAAAVERMDGAVVVIGTSMPTLGPFHADAVRSDFAAGVDVAVGPSHDGGWYLIALAEPRPELFALPAGAWEGGGHVHGSARAGRRAAARGRDAARRAQARDARRRGRAAAPSRAARWGGGAPTGASIASMR